MITMCLEKLLETDYVLLDFEAQIIVPYILEKSGHAKDRIAKLYGAIMVHLANCCSTNKYAAYVVKALESKNTRTQTSCLTELARLIDLTGLDVIGSKGLKKIVKCVDGKDQNVRNAALDGITSAYMHLGGADQLFKLLGSNTPDKTVSLIEARLKRAGPPKPPSAPAAPADVGNDGGPSSPPPPSSSPETKTRVALEFIVHALLAFFCRRVGKIGSFLLSYKNQIKPGIQSF